MPRKTSDTSPSKLDVQAKQAFPLTERLNKLISDTTALRKHLGCTSQTISQYKTGTARPSLENLCKIADFYNVSTDYLLGRTNEPSTDTDVRAVHTYTGLDGESIELLHRNVEFGYLGLVAVIDTLLCDECYQNVENGRKYRSIFNLLEFFFSYSGTSKTQCSVTEHGDFFETGKKVYAQSTPAGTKWLNTIDIDSQMVENAVLLELNRALISLKEKIKERK